MPVPGTNARSSATSGRRRVPSSATLLPSKKALNLALRFTADDGASAPAAMSMTDTTGEVTVLTSALLTAQTLVVKSHLPPTASQSASLVQALLLAKGPVGPLGEAQIETT